MSTPVPEIPVLPETSPAFSFGGYAAPSDDITGVSFWPRAVARVIDLITHLVIATGTYFLFGVLLAIAAGLTGQPPALLVAKLGNNHVLNFVFALLGSIAYETLCEGLHGSTLGKIVLSMVVVQEDGSPCRLKSALVRSLGYFVDSLFFGIVGYFAMQRTTRNQRYGDDWAETVVCKRSAVPAGNLRGAGRFTLGLLLGAMADSALITVGLVIAIMS